MRSWFAYIIALCAIANARMIPQPARCGEVGDGRRAADAILVQPTGLALHDSFLYVVETAGGRLRRIDLRTGKIATVAGGGTLCAPAGDASLPSYAGAWSPKQGCLGFPQRVAVDRQGGVYITDEAREAVIKVGTEPHSFSIVSVGGSGSQPDSVANRSSSLEWPTGIAADDSGNLFVNEQTTAVVFRLSVGSGSLEMVAGGREDGAVIAGGRHGEHLRDPDGLARDSSGDLFIADYGNCRILRLDIGTSALTTVAGTLDDGSTCDSLPETAVIEDQPSDVAVDLNNHLYFVQPWRCRVRRIDLFSGAVTTVAGNGEEGLSGDGSNAVRARLHFPRGIAVDKNGDLYIADTDNNRVRRVDSRTGLITTIAGRGMPNADVQY
jgi:sugar lactone lactonase YvrE